jgi:hypothetical protein
MSSCIECGSRRSEHDGEKAALYGLRSPATTRTRIGIRSEGLKGRVVGAYIATVFRNGDSLRGTDNVPRQIKLGCHSRIRIAK